MRQGGLFRFLFFFYCLEAAGILIVSPWSSFLWDRLVVQIPLAELRDFLLLPFARSLVTAFGVLHLVWAAHDLRFFLASLRRSDERR